MADCHSLGAMGADMAALQRRQARTAATRPTATIPLLRLRARRHPGETFTACPSNRDTYRLDCRHDDYFPKPAGGWAAPSGTSRTPPPPAGQLMTGLRPFAVREVILRALATMLVALLLVLARPPRRPTPCSSGPTRPRAASWPTRPTPCASGSPRISPHIHLDPPGRRAGRTVPGTRVTESPSTPRRGAGPPVSCAPGRTPRSGRSSPRTTATRPAAWSPSGSGVARPRQPR